MISLCRPVTMPPRSTRLERLETLQRVFAEFTQRMLAPTPESDDDNLSSSDDQMSIMSSPLSDSLLLNLSSESGSAMVDSQAEPESDEDDLNISAELLQIFSQSYLVLRQKILNPVPRVPVPRFPQLGLLRWAQDHNDRYRPRLLVGFR